MRADTDKFIEPFRIAVPDAYILDLRARLARTRWPDAGAGAWADGTDLEYLETLVDYWRDEFDWRRVEARINERRSRCVRRIPRRDSVIARLRFLRKATG